MFGTTSRPFDSNTWRDDIRTILRPRPDPRTRATAAVLKPHMYLYLYIFIFIRMEYAILPRHSCITAHITREIKQKWRIRTTLRARPGPRIHCYLKLTEVPLLLSDVPTLDFCLGEQRSSTPTHPRKGNTRNCTGCKEAIYYVLFTTSHPCLNHIASI